MSSYIQKDRLPALLKLPFAIYKWVFVAPFLAFSTFVIATIISIFCALGAPDFASRVFATRWARINAAASMMKVNIKGLEKIDKTKSYVIVANHQSLIDILVLYGSLDMEIKWVMKQELRSVPFLGIACQLMGHILIDRSNTESALESINNARERIQDGMSVVFFPEGTRSRSGELKNFKKGAFRLAQELELPILPVAIHGTKDVLPSDTVDLSPGTVTLEFCEPIPAMLESEEPDNQKVTTLSRKAREAIHEALQND